MLASTLQGWGWCMLSINIGHNLSPVRCLVTLALILHLVTLPHVPSIFVTHCTRVHFSVPVGVWPVQSKQTMGLTTVQFCMHLIAFHVMQTPIHQHITVVGSGLHLQKSVLTNLSCFCTKVNKAIEEEIPVSENVRCPYSFNLQVLQNFKCLRSESRATSF